MSSSTSPAPALDRGITVLNLLSKEGELSLETITNLTKIPKASLLRFLETLRVQGCVKRDPRTKKFSALMTLNPVLGEMDDFSRMKRDVMENLSTDHNVTVEWYEFKGDDLVLSHRVEPESQIVNVSARVGYVRRLDYEFEAVAKVALANSPSKIEKGAKYFEVERNEKCFRTPKEIEEILTDVRASGLFAEDLAYNQKGVRRIANGIVDEDGKLLGILSLAFTKEDDQEIAMKYAGKSLSYTSKTLAKQYKRMMMMA